MWVFLFIFYSIIFFIVDVLLDGSHGNPSGSFVDRSRLTEKRGSIFGIPSFHQLRRMSDTSMRQVKERLRRMSTTGDWLTIGRSYTLSICPIVRVLVHVSKCLSMCPNVYTSFWMSIFLSECLSIWLFAYLPDFLSIYLSIYPIYIQFFLHLL